MGQMLRARVDRVQPRSFSRAQNSAPRSLSLIQPRKLSSCYFWSKKTLHHLVSSCSFSWTLEGRESRCCMALPRQDTQRYRCFFARTLQKWFSQAFLSCLRAVVPPHKQAIRIDFCNGPTSNPVASSAFTCSSTISQQIFYYDCYRSFLVVFLVLPRRSACAVSGRPGLIKRNIIINSTTLY
eukprot:2099477-Rhodomonas_salina.1